MRSQRSRPTWREARIQEQINKVIEDPAVHFWLRDALVTALTKDPVDALNDAEYLYLLLKERWQAILDADNFLEVRPEAERWLE